MEVVRLLIVVVLDGESVGSIKGVDTKYNLSQKHLLDLPQSSEAELHWQ